jgi:protein-disulfide isomerase/uncharacterized membrane protein
MNKKINLLLLSLFGLILTFAYLTFHHYSLILGLSQATLCHISQTLNCDAAALSSYSEFLGIPIAIFGLSFSFVMFFVILFIKLNWIETHPSVTHTIQFLFTLSAGLSIVLGAVSVLKLGVVCPFCFLSYLLLIISCVLVFKIFKFDASKVVFGEVFEHKGFLLTLVFVPFLAWFASSTIQSSFGYDELKKVIPEKIAQWKTMPVQTFDLSLGLKKGDLTSANSLIEFADFKCPHCKAAAETFKNFEKSNPKMKIIFKPFPLDGQCNPHVSFKGDGSRCQMAGLTLCADKISQNGWLVHDYFFDNQENLAQVTDMKPVFKDFAVKNNLNVDEIIKCSESSETYDLIRKMADEAKTAQVEGTPAIFMNQQKLGHGQFLQVLKEAYSTLK